MDQHHARERATKLRKEIDRYRHAYHVLDQELISPDALDSLKRELAAIEARHPELITPDSPTQRVGGKPLAAFKKVRHVTPMLSLNDAFSEEDLRGWFERAEHYLREPIRTDFYCNLKMDGLAIELTYERGLLVRGATRGDGLVGEDVTQNLKTIEAVPLRLREPVTVTVRGEAFLTKKELERINRTLERAGKPVYANPRNLAAGSIRQLDPKVSASRKLKFFAYDMVEYQRYRTHAEVRQGLQRFGFAINEHGQTFPSLDGVIGFHRKWERAREQLPYEFDGVFITINRNDVYARLGVVGKAPRGAIAFKFSPREATTKVHGIVVQVGRTGALTPVAVLEPVEVGGVTISRATLHNYDEIERLGLKIGDTVTVSRAGDVIPQVTKVLVGLRTGNEKNFSMPSRCPIDGSKVARAGAIYRCLNPRCGARHRESLYHFVSRAALDIRGLGPKIIDRFLDEGLVADAADLFTLRIGDVAALERFGEKSAANLVQEIASRKRIPTARFLYSLGIPHVGEGTAIALAKHLPVVSPSVAELAKRYRAFSRENLEQVPDVGPTVAEGIYRWFHEPRNMALLGKLGRVGVGLLHEKRSMAAGKLSGKTLVLTGVLASMSRDEAKATVRSQGGTISESVSKRTTYVVAGKGPGAKLGEAKRLGIPVLTEPEFLKLLRDS